MNILFVGNSYTYYNDMPVMLEQLARENGKQTTVYSVTKGGRKLFEYALPDDVTVKLDKLLSARRYDICIIQEQSLLPLKTPGLFFSGLEDVVNKLSDRVDRLILYATWGRKEGNKDLATLKLTTQSMAQQLQDAYFEAAQRVKAEVSPVGMHFLKVYQEHPEMELYDSDGSHPSYQGSCLSALTHYRTIFGQLPEHTDCLTLSAAERSAFRSAVAESGLLLN